MSGKGDEVLCSRKTWKRHALSARHKTETSCDIHSTAIELLAPIHQLRLAHVGLKLAELRSCASTRICCLAHCVNSRCTISIPTHVRMAAMCCEYKTMIVSRSLRSRFLKSRCGWDSFFAFRFIVYENVFSFWFATSTATRWETHGEWEMEREGET